MINLQVSPNGDDGILDTLIAVFIILLILSLINEKIVDLIRKYIKVPDKVNRFNWMKNIGTEYSDKPEINQKKKKEISLLAFLIGVGVAAFSKANIFDLITNPDPRSTLFWEAGENPENWFLFILGILLTGLFLSFGSNLFHDLLDTLYQTKEYKRKLQSNQLLGFRNVQDLSDFLHTSSESLAREALRIHGKEINRKYNKIISNMQLGTTSSNQIGIIVTLTAPRPAEFPQNVPVKLPNGGIIQVPVEAFEPKKGSAQFGLEFRLQNPDFAGSTGALGGILVKKDGDDKKYILTCSHVALGGRSDNLGGTIANPSIETEVLDNGQQQAMGTLVYAKLDSTNDTALVALDDWDTTGWDNELPDGNFYQEAVPVDTLSLNEGVKFYSSKNRTEVEGVIHLLKSQETISLEYDDMVVKEFEGLIVVGNNTGGNWNSISEKGDSGSILYDSDYNPFGLIIGGSTEFTFAIPLSNILSSTNTRILTNQFFV